MKAKESIPRYLAVVRMKESAKTWLTPIGVATYFPFGKSARFLFMGEIPNQPGHCVVLLVGKSQKPLEPIGFHHTSCFEEVPEDEV